MILVRGGLRKSPNFYTPKKTHQAKNEPKKVKNLQKVILRVV